MASVFAGALQSTRLLSFASLPSPKFTSHSLSNWCLKSRPRTIATNFSFKSRNSALSGSRFLVRAIAEEFSPDVGQVLGDVRIFTAAGEPVLFKDLWDQTEGVAVVALLRHFGCPCCWELASALKEAKATFDSAGVKLIAVGIGTPNKAQILAQRLPFPMDCLYADPDCKAYNLFGLYYGIGRTFFNPASVKVLSRFGALQKAVKNYTIEATPDDKRGVLQQGGMFVFKGKDLLYAWRDEGTGDHAPLDDIFSICCRVPA
ncbi:prostamide/prostaglandin F synthase [Pistacia vera]|uniref:prostamide/prostaglandin F synthase n=1 Tax=Pistacia vera TaxID=55513 RepID=UPI0012630BD5|nr:prostamide/prostaglandin F synthase [Pistacia vera]